MERIKTTDARREFAELLSRVEYGDERFIITRNGKDVAAIISFEDIELLEAAKESRENAT